MSGIRIEGLVKEYPRTRELLKVLRHPLRRERVPALRSIDLALPRGGIYALLGPNGAGKTTLLKILGGLLLPDRGTVRIDGDDLTGDPDEVRARVGLIVCDERSFFWRLSAFENLRFFASLYGYRGADRKAQVERCLAATDLEKHAQKQFMRMSTGMRQRLALARGLLVDRDILLMDEATRSLDPESRTRIHELVMGLLKNDPNRIIVYSTHDLAEAEILADHVVVIREGQIVTVQSLEQDTGERRGRTYEVQTEPDMTAADAAGIDGLQLLHLQDRRATVGAASVAALDALVGQLRQNGKRIVEVSPKRSSLAELYMESVAEGEART